MFESTQTPSWRGAISIGWLIEAVLVGLLVIVPLVRVQDLPQALPGVVLVAPPPTGAPKTARTASAPRTARPQPMLTPPFIPTTIISLSGRPESELQAPVLSSGAVPWDANDALGGFNTGGTPVPPAPAPRRDVSPVRVGGQVEGAKLIFQVKPAYPEIARMARVQGAVRLEAVISKEGTVASLKVVSGPPLLVKAAFDAVSQWRYQPTLLNGEPVEVATEIEVNFSLGE
jgi:periplasmic protein TonB